MFIFTNASQFAGAGINDNKIVQFMFDTQDRDKSSTWRELTVQNNILSLKSDLSGKFVKLYTDNQNVVQIIKRAA